MHDGDFTVDILNNSGTMVGSKLRKDIVKGQDIYHAVYGVIRTPDAKFAISRIAARTDLPNLHAGSYGCTAATIRRSGETAEQAMARALKNELGSTAKPQLVFEKVIAIDNTYRKVTLYLISEEVPVSFSKDDIDEIIVLSKEEALELLANQPAKVTPVLRLFFDTI